MPTAFERAFAVVIGNEGGYVNNPADPGGETRYGVSKRAYPKVDIAHLTLDDARAIYRRDYWDKIRGDDLPAPVALVVFDYAVNSGFDRAARLLQQTVGARQDGLIGPATLAAVAAQSGKGAALIAEYNAQRMVYLVSLPRWPTFGLGWARRVAKLPFFAIHMEQTP